MTTPASPTAHDPSRPPRVRIAPSPTGDPHVGTAYIALFNYCFARSHKSGHGKFILRIEDTDRTRSTLDSELAILRSLRWVGLTWDEGPDVGGPHAPYRQSERSEHYARHAEQLLQNATRDADGVVQTGAYLCFCTAARLAELREQQKKLKQNAGYDRLCRRLPQGEAMARRTAGEPCVVRLAMPTSGETEFQDGLRGKLTFDNATIDDQVLLKTDGMPTYHLANVVDDHLMEITHVIRAEEWISSTPKHVVLYRYFGWQAPEFIHMPLLRNADKSKISKRKNPVSLDYYREAGFLPEALLNFLGLMGWSFGEDREKFTLAEMIERFTFDRISLGGPVFDLVKLEDLNAQYLRELSDGDLWRRLQAWMFHDEYIGKVVPLVHERLRRLSDFARDTVYFLGEPMEYDVAQLLPKGRTAEETAGVLGTLCEKLDESRSWKAEELEPFFRSFCDTASWKAKDLFMVIRIAVTGRVNSPPLFTTMETVGRERCRSRLRQAAARLSEAAPRLKAAKPQA
jgi:glutamyl-tRNA synthetase